MKNFLNFLGVYQHRQHQNHQHFGLIVSQMENISNAMAYVEYYYAVVCQEDVRERWSEWSIHILIGIECLIHLMLIDAWFNTDIHSQVWMNDIRNICSDVDRGW